MNLMIEEVNVVGKMNDWFVLVFIGESLKLYEKGKSFSEGDGKFLKLKSWKIIYIGYILL